MLKRQSHQTISNNFQTLSNTNAPKQLSNHKNTPHVYIKQLRRTGIRELGIIGETSRRRIHYWFAQKSVSWIFGRVCGASNLQSWRNDEEYRLESFCEDG